LAEVLALLGQDCVFARFGAGEKVQSPIGTVSAEEGKHVY
jgi:hypothetical protein